MGTVAGRLSGDVDGVDVPRGAGQLDYFLGTIILVTSSPGEYVESLGGGAVVNFVE